MSPARTGAALAALLTLTSLCCLPSIDAPFTYDELAGITENRAVRPGATLLQAAQYRFSPDQTRPLFFVSLLLDARAHGTEPRGYRITNLALHLLCGLALFRLLRRTPAPPAAALAGTAVFLLHPVQSESIIYVWGRSGVLAALFSLLCLLLVPWGDGARGGRGLVPWIGALASLSLALAAKEEPVVLPLLGFLWWTMAESRPWRAAAARSAVLALVVALFLSLRLTVLGAVGRQVFARGVGENVLAQAVVTLRMLRLVLLPYGQSVDPLAPVPSRATGIAALVACLILAAGAATAAWCLRSSAGRDGWRLTAAGVATAGAGCLLYWVVPLPDLMSERRFYLPMAGVALAVCGLVAAAQAALSRRRPAAAGALAWGAAVLLAAILAPLLLGRSRLWTDPRRLWEEARRLAPDKARPLINLGVLAAESGERGLAAEYLDRVVRLEPRNPEALYNRGKLRLDAGDARGAAADLDAAAEADPTPPRIWIILGIARQRLGDTAGAREALKTALAIDPGEPRALTNLAEVLRSEGRGREAIPLYRKALASDPGYAHAAARLGVALEAEGDPRGAIAAYREYLARGARSPTDREAVLERIRALEAALSPPASPSPP